MLGAGGVLMTRAFVVPVVGLMLACPVDTPAIEGSSSGTGSSGTGGSDIGQEASIMSL